MRSQNLKKGGGFFERVRQLQATLTRIAIALESDSHGLPEIVMDISAEIGNTNGYSAQKQVTSKKKKKKRSSLKLRRIFRPKSEIQTVFPPKNRSPPKKKKKKKKKRVFTEIETDFLAEIGNPHGSSSRITATTSQLRHPNTLGELF